MPPSTTRTLSVPSLRTTRRLTVARYQPRAIRPTGATLPAGCRRWWQDATAAGIRLLRARPRSPPACRRRRGRRGRRTRRGGARRRGGPSSGTSPRRPGGEQRVAALTAVRGGDDVAAVGAPALDHAGDRRRRQVGPVGHDHERRLDVVAERRQPAPERGARAASQSAQRTRRTKPCRTGSQRVGALDDDDLVDGAAARRSRTRGSSRRCFGEPKRVAAPAARTTAATRLTTRRR